MDGTGVTGGPLLIRESSPLLLTHEEAESGPLLFTREEEAGAGCGSRRRALVDDGFNAPPPAAGVAFAGVACVAAADVEVVVAVFTAATATTVFFAGAGLFVVAARSGVLPRAVTASAGFGAGAADDSTACGRTNRPWFSVQ